MMHKNLTNKIAGFNDDPLGFVKFVFPWGADNLKVLEFWQQEALKKLGDKSKSTTGPIKYAISKGLRVGGTAFLAWIVLWFLSTKPNGVIIFTSATKGLLYEKSWAELKKWHSLMINKDWFELEEHINYKSIHLAGEKYFFGAAHYIPWEKDKPERFTGFMGDNILVVFDEPPLDDTAWDVVSGCMHGNSCIWIALGSPVNNKGRFKECFEDPEWETKTIDGRDSSLVCKGFVENAIKDYGLNSDFVKIRVLGQFT